jgi:integrating conjugative element protein (TIGR03765 family)
MSAAPGRSQASSHRSPQGEGTPVSAHLSRLLLASLIALPFASATGWCADLEVIHDGAGSVPLGTYYGHLVSGVDQAGVLPGTRFPLTTALKPGRLISAGSGDGLFDTHWLAHPIFVLGTDDLSFQWLQQHRQTLQTLGASGLVIEASSETKFKDLQAFAGGVSVAPVRGPWLEQKLLSAGISRYPIVVMPDGRITDTAEPEGRVK